MTAPARSSAAGDAPAPVDIVLNRGRRLRVTALPGPAGRPGLVFLHEALGSVRLWRGFPAALARASACPAWLYDRPGFGDSGPAPAARGRDYLHRDAEDLAALLAALAIERAVLLGHSDGGSIALLCAARYPERVVGVVTEAAHVFVEEATLAGIRAAVAAYETGDLAARLARHHGPRTAAIFRAWADTWLAPWFRDWDIRAELATLRRPVLAIQGEGDRYGTPAQLAAIAAGAAGPVELALLPGCGHAPHLEAPERVLPLVAGFVARLAAGEVPAGQGGGSSIGP